MLFKDSQRKKINHNVWKQAIPTLWSKTEGSDPLQLSRNLQNIEEIFLAFPASILKRTLNFQHSRIFHKLETGFLKTHYKFPKSSNYRRFPNNMKYNKTHIHTQKKPPKQSTNQQHKCFQWRSSLLWNMWNLQTVFVFMICVMEEVLTIFSHKTKWGPFRSWLY